MKQSEKTRHKEILAFIKSVRESFPDASIIYTYGGCYGFHRILKQVFPSAVPYMTENEQHIVTRIDGRFYDILGEYINLNGSLPRQLVRLNAKQKEYWETVACGQRVEKMLKKYKKQ